MSVPHFEFAIGNRPAEDPAEGREEPARRRSGEAPLPRGDGGVAGVHAADWELGDAPELGPLRASPVRLSTGLGSLVKWQ